MSDDTERRLRAALIRLCWILVADESECSCEFEGEEVVDECPACEAFKALGLGPWPFVQDDEDVTAWERAEEMLVKVKP